MARSVSALGLVCTLLLTAVNVQAQSTLGSLAGTVRDASELALPGASITLVNQATGATQATVTSAVGTFVFPLLPAGSYRVDVAFPGMQSRSYAIVISVGREYSLSAQLTLGAVTEVVQVTAGEMLVSTTTPEVGTTVLQRQILDIPLLNRDITNLIKLQAGVAGISNRANTVINGGRPTWTQVSLDGINIQDNFIRTNALDFLPNRPTSDNVAEFSITTSVAGADTAGGTSTVRMVTPSGTNQLRGSVFESNRSSRFAANSFFNNSSGVEKPELKRNEYGGRVGGPLLRDRLFFWAHYEARRQTTQTTQNLAIPANADFLDGVFRYVALDGTVRAVNVLQLAGLTADPRLRADFLSKLPAASKVNNFDTGNSAAGRILNTAGYRFNQTDLNNRDSFTLRGDYRLSGNHQFEGIFSRFRETDDRTDLDRISPDRPLVYTDGVTKRFVGAWRSTWGQSLQNELRAGANLAPALFNSDWEYTGEVLYNTIFSIVNPVGGQGTGGTTAGFQPQGRYTNTYQLTDSATWLKGQHQLQMGGSWQRVRVNPFNFAGRYPVVTFGLSAAAPPALTLTSPRFPGGISAADLANANLMAAWLAGIVSSVSQTFQVRDATSGFVAGIPANENYTLDDINAYVQDTWRLKPNLSIRAGLKWEYYSPLREDDNLGFLPVLGGRTTDAVMRDRAATVSFVNGDFYRKDLNNFGPTIGFAWDPTNDGRTAVRGGYSLTFVNEDTVTVARATARSNAGLSTAVNLTNQFRTVSQGVPIPATPAFLTTRTLADQMTLSSSAVLWGIDNGIASPHVHQVSAGIQRELAGRTAVEARYVGSFGRGIWRGTDLNQMTMSPEFLADFTRARNNGYLAQAAGLGFVPTFNPALAGSQPLTLLTRFGLFTNATVLNRIQTGQAAGLADFYVTSRVAGAIDMFMPNPAIYSANLIANGGYNDYNALQVEVRRRVSSGLFAQVNYTLSQTNTDSEGTGQNRFEAFMDNNRPELNQGRSFFHQTHVVNANAIVDLPFGAGRRWLNDGGLASTLAGDWQIGTIVTWQSGSPFTIFSGRGTFNRIGRSDCAVFTVCNTAISTLSVQEIQKLLGIHKLPDGRIFWIDPRVVDPATGRAVGADNQANAAAFPGQVFFNPGAGEVGNLPIQAFDGPAQFRIDVALSKRIRFGTRVLEVQAEAFNLLNQPSFFRGDMDINSTTFGRLTSVNVGARVVQLGVRFDF